VCILPNQRLYQDTNTGFHRAPSSPVIPDGLALRVTGYPMMLLHVLDSTVALAGRTNSNVFVFDWAIHRFAP
jgi:hypothetical protein